jgi:photosystem II stability/assembly factor-like uncharacterized protein
MGGFASPLSKSAPPGAKLQSNWLYFSRNGGRTFTHGSELAPFLDEVVAAPTSNVLLVDRNIANATANSEELIRSADGGRHWSVVYQGWILSMSFQSENQGVGLVQTSSSTNSMIMTFDGGRHWARVSL